MGGQNSGRKGADKIVTGPWISEIPEPDLPLGRLGKKRYGELCRALLEQQKLTVVTLALVEQVAVLTDEQERRIKAKLGIPLGLTDKMQRALAQLKIAEGARQIGGHPRENKFAGSGFAHRGAAPVRLRRVAAGSD